MRINRKMFVFYWVIIFLLLTVLIAVLEMNRKIPDMIAQPVSAMQADRMILFVEDSAKMNDLLGDCSYDICDCTMQKSFTGENLSVLQDHDNKHVFLGGILLNHSYSDSCQLSDLKNALIDGAMCSSQRNGLWISEELQEESGLCCGDTVEFCLEDGTVVCDLTVFGVFFAELANNSSYYVTEDVYHTYSCFKPYDKLMIVIVPDPFRNIFQIISLLRKQNVDFIYSEQTVNALSMVYVLFAALVLVLLITFFSILNHLLQFYYDKRRRFFAVNAAIGMDRRSTAKIMVLTAECLVLSALIAAFISALLIFNEFNYYIGDLFDLAAENSFFSLSTILITVITVQADVMLVLFQFFKRNHTDHIIAVIREN